MLWNVICLLVAVAAVAVRYIDHSVTIDVIDALVTALRSSTRP